MMEDDRALPIHAKSGREWGPDGTHRNEEKLRGSFAALRREDEPLVPEFALLWRSKARASRRHGRWLVAAASVLLVLMGIFWLRSARRPEINTSAAITQWK